MEALAKLVAEVTEFLVGGVLFLGSLALLMHAFFSDAFRMLAERQLPETAGGALSIIALALMYAFGVIAEGSSRMLFEARLTQLTVQRQELFADRQRVARVVADLGGAAKTGEATEEASTPGLDELGSRMKRKVAIILREEWRAAATSYNESLGNTIEAQLKRLRIERTFVLSGLVCVVALAVEGNWVLVAVTAVLCVVGAMLVEERFKRFLGAIVRAHVIMAEGRAKFDSGVPTGASA